MIYIYMCVYIYIYCIYSYPQRLLTASFWVPLRKLGDFGRLLESSSQTQVRFRSNMAMYITCVITFQYISNINILYIHSILRIYIIIYIYICILDYFWLLYVYNTYTYIGLIICVYLEPRITPCLAHRSSFWRSTTQEMKEQLGFRYI